MKYKNYIVIIAIFTMNCASIHNKIVVTENNRIVDSNDSIGDKHSVLNDFFKYKMKNYSKKIIIVTEKINTNTTLRMLRINNIDSIDPVTRKTIKEDKTFYKEEEWEKTRKKYSKNSIEEIKNATSSGGECCWTKEYFNYENVILEKLNIGSPAFEKKYLESPDYEYYYFSEPIYYQNKEYLIFTVHQGNIIGGLGGSSHIIIYGKINGKWLQTHVGYSDWFN
jgi:hypothetical protein